MLDKETIKSPPPSWGDDDLSNYINAATNQAFITFVRGKDAYKNKNLYKNLVSVDKNFSIGCKNLINPKDNLSEAAGVFMMRAHSAYRVACHLAMNTQIPESFPVMRVGIEYSLSALRIQENPPALEIFIKREEDKKTFLKEFYPPVLLDTLKDTDKELYKIVKTLYDRCIDFGAHPNPLAIGNSMQTTETNEERHVRIIYLHDDPRTIGHSMHTVAQVGLACLCIFQIIFGECFENLGINAAINKLREQGQL